MKHTFSCVTFHICAPTYVVFVVPFYLEFHMTVSEIAKGSRDLCLGARGTTVTRAIMIYFLALWKFTLPP